MLGRTLRIESSGGSVNNSVVSMPTAIPWTVASRCQPVLPPTWKNFVISAGRICSTTRPTATPASPPAKPSIIVCNVKMRMISRDVPPSDFMTAM